MKVLFKLLVNDFLGTVKRQARYQVISLRILRFEKSIKIEKEGV